MSKPIPRVLSIAGTDPTGGAGVQADLKSISAAGGYAMNVVTALVAQNTQGVRSVHLPDVDFLSQQLEVVSDDVVIDAVKIGMLGSVEIIEAVSRWLSAQHVPVVLDPVMIATSGDRLLSEDAENALRNFLPHATVITPNIPELAVLGNTAVASSMEEAIVQAKDLAQAHRVAVIVKGGHLSGQWASNALVTADAEPFLVPSPRVDTTNTHGTGCSLSAALATRMCMQELPAALAWTTSWLHEAITHGHALEVGQGHGPVDHFHRLRRAATAAQVLPVFPSSNAALAPHIPAAGPLTESLFRQVSGLLQQIYELPFIRGLAQSTLDPEQFSFYQDQDAQYLVQYSKSLARLATLAPDTQSQLAWAQAAQECLSVESLLHQEWLGADYESCGPSTITRGYTDFLLARTHTEDYVVAMAAILPCYWLYAEVGNHLAQHNHEGHRYQAWLNMYGGEEFNTATAAAIARLEEALSKADSQTQERARQAFYEASAWELAFFDQADRIEF